MRQDTLIDATAAELGLDVLERLRGGEFGALRVRRAGGEAAVLKALPGPRWLESFTEGARLSTLMAGSGYPAPRYFDVGATPDATWSLQEVMPGQVPESMSVDHVAGLVELAQAHARPAGASVAWRDYEGPITERARTTPAPRADARRLIDEALGVLDGLDPASVLTDTVVHGDFHIANFLAQGDRVSAVFDWEFARAGDWRFDLVTLAFWTTAIPGLVPAPAAAIARAAMREHCPPPIVAGFAAMLAVKAIDFDVHVHPGRLDDLLTVIDGSVAPWWRSAG